MIKDLAYQTTETWYSSNETAWGDPENQSSETILNVQRRTKYLETFAHVEMFGLLIK